MKFSLPFLAYRLDQIPSEKECGNQCVEAIVFDRRDLEETQWKLIWEGVQEAANRYRPHNATFHFPVNDSDYVEDFFVKKRLIEALARASDLGIEGVVVHSNRVSLLENWKGRDLKEERMKVIEALGEVRKKVSGATWLALENMPVMDNYGLEIDPLFVYPEDFEGLRQTGVKAVFDICHFSNTQANLQEVFSGRQNSLYYPSIKKAGDLDFLHILDLIAHWHFSAFLGVANPETRETCKEGVLPSKGSLGEEYYQKIFCEIVERASASSHMVFEIQEENYQDRKEGRKMLKWARDCLPQRQRDVCGENSLYWQQK